MCNLMQHSQREEPNEALDLKWVWVDDIKGWVREYDPRTQSGLMPAQIEGGA